MTDSPMAIGAGWGDIHALGHVALETNRREEVEVGCERIPIRHRDGVVLKVCDVCTKFSAGLESNTCTTTIAQGWPKLRELAQRFE